MIAAMQAYISSLLTARWERPEILWLLIPAVLIITAAGLLRRRPLLSLLLRCLSAALLVLILAEPLEVESTSSEELPVLFDVSYSISPAARTAMADKLEEFVGRSGTRLAVYPFAKTAAARPIELNGGGDIKSLSAELTEAAKGLDTGETDLSQAFRSVLGRSAAGSVVLLTDGFETAGDSRQALAQAAGKGVKVFPLLPDKSKFEKLKISISAIFAPVTAKAGDRAEVSVSIKNEQDAQAEADLQIWLEKEKLFSSRITVAAHSEKVIPVATAPLKGGLHRLRAVLAPPESRVDERLKEEKHRWISVKEKQKILLISGTEEDEKVIKELIRYKGYGLEDIVADGKKPIPQDFENYASIVLNNTPKAALAPGYLDKIRSFVAEGGGLLMLGGDRSYGLGGYIGTPLEEISPVKFLPPQTEKRRLTTAIVLLLDKSGSMAEQGKILSAKVAALRSVQALKDDDYISVIGFDHAPFVIIPLQKVAEAKPQAERRLENLTAAGQTNPLPALAAARQKLAASDASRKHIIVMSDGKFPLSDEPYVAEISELRKEGVTVSAVALGVEADVPFMKLLAQYGRGAFYQTVDASQLPQVFVQDIKVATGEKTMKEQQEFGVGLGPDGPLSTTLQRFPALRGFVQTVPKKGAALELITGSEGQMFPILSSWNYGSGKVIAFTSDANGRWSLPWLRWPAFAKFWAEIIEQIKDRSGKKNSELDFDLRYTVNRGSLALDLSVFDPRLKSEAAPRITGAVAVAGAGSKTVGFRQVRKGRFESVIPGAKPGDYRIDLNYGGFKLPPLALTLGGEVFGEAPGRGVNTQNLAEIAYLTEGAINPERSQVLGRRRVLETRRPLFMPLALLAFGLIILEAVLREWGAGALFWSLLGFGRRTVSAGLQGRPRGTYFDAKRPPARRAAAGAKR